MIHDGSVKPDSANYLEGADSETFVMGSDTAEFVNKVKDQVRSRQKRMSNVAESGEEHSTIWGMFMAATMNAATFMGKNFLTIQNFIMNSEDLTLKQMFDITAKLVGEQDEINGLDNIHWGKNSWRQLSLIGDDTVINLQRTKVYVFSDSVLCLGRILQHPESKEAWKKRIAGVMSEKSYRYYDGINEKPTEFEWNIFPGFTTLQLCGKVNDLLSDLGETPETFTGRILLMSMINDISCDRKGNKEECLATARVVKVLSKKFGIGQWSFIGPGSEKKWYSGEENSPQGAWDHIADEMLLEFAESGCPIFRATTPHCPGAFSRAKDMENCQYTSLQIMQQLKPSKNGTCSQITKNSQNRSVQTFGFVYHDTNGLNHGPVLKTQLFLLSGICTVILWQDYHGKGYLRKSY